MDKIKYRLIAGFLLAFTLLLKTCHCQQNTLFNQSPFQQRQSPFQRQQLRQRQPLQQQQTQQQQQQLFSNSLNNINPLNSLQPISPIIPQNVYNRNYNQINPQNFVPITAYQNELNYDGSFSYGYAAGDGTTAQAQGYVKNLGLGEAVEAQVVQGSYSYTSPEGTPITVRYIADENGFRAEGAHIPTPPPIPDAIAKSLQYTSGIQNPYQQDFSPNLNPYQTPFRQYPQNLRPGQQSQLNPLQLQQQQRFLQQNSGQYQPDNQFGFSPPSPLPPGSQFSPGGSNQFQTTPFGSNPQQSQGNLFPQQQNLTQQQQQNRQQQLNNNQQQQGDQQQQQQQQQQLATQELRSRPNQLLIAGFLLAFTLLLKTCHCQQNTLFNQSPFQQRQSPFQRQQLRQRQPLQQQQTQQQQQQLFSNSLNNLNPLNSLQPISPIIPQNVYNRNYNQINPQNFVPITAYQNELNYDGSFSYGYAAGDGTTAQAQGYVKNLGLGEAVEAQVVQGSYSYTSPEGTPITVRYIADENGFRAEGAHIPTPPPIPDAIAKSLQYTSGIQNPYQQDFSPNLNPYQTPFRQYPQNLRPGQQSQLNPLQLQQQQRFLQQNSGQYQPDNQFGFSPPSPLPPGSQFSPGGSNQFQTTPFGSNPQQSLGNLFPQQQNLTQQQQQNRQQQLNNNQQQQQQGDQQQQQQQQLATQELRSRPNQLVNPFGYNSYRRYKKSTSKSARKDEH